MCAWNTVLTCKLGLPTQPKFIRHGCAIQYHPWVSLFLLNDPKAMRGLHVHEDYPSIRCSSSILNRFLLDHRPHFRYQNHPHHLLCFFCFLNINSQLIWRASKALRKKFTCSRKELFFELTQVFLPLSRPVILSRIDGSGCSSSTAG